MKPLAIAATPSQKPSVLFLIYKKEKKEKREKKKLVNI